MLGKNVPSGYLLQMECFISQANQGPGIDIDDFSQENQVLQQNYRNGLADFHAYLVNRYLVPFTPWSRAALRVY
jgi:hypothetical protein